MEAAVETEEGDWSIHPNYGQIRNVLDTLNAGVLVRTLEGQILFANERMLQWVGYSPKELDGQNIRILIPESCLLISTDDV